MPTSRQTSGSTRSSWSRFSAPICARPPHLGRLLRRASWRRSQPSGRFGASRRACENAWANTITGASDSAPDRPTAPVSTIGAASQPLTTGFGREELSGKITRFLPTWVEVSQPPAATGALARLAGVVVVTDDGTGIADAFRAAIEADGGRAVVLHHRGAERRLPPGSSAVDLADPIDVVATVERIVRNTANRRPGTPVRFGASLRWRYVPPGRTGGAVAGHGAYRS